jgi:hypothetical protein
VGDIMVAVAAVVGHMMVAVAAVVGDMMVAVVRHMMVVVAEFLVLQR